MRPASRLAVTLWTIAICFLTVLPSLSGLATAQSAGSKDKLSHHSPPSQHPVASVAIVRRATPNAPPALTADSWTGTAGDNNWGTAGNWNAGVPTSASAVTIGTTTANVNMNVTGNFGTLTLSNSGDVLNILNADVLNAFGNITNNGALNLNSSGSSTQLVLQGNVTLSGSGTVTLSNNAGNVIFGAVTSDILTNQETIQGAGSIGGSFVILTLENSGTSNANQSAGLTIETDEIGR